MNFRPIFYINGILLLILSAAMLIPALVDLANRSADWKVFAGAQIITAFAGFALLFSNRQKKFSMTLRETFVLTCISWVLMAAFAALPFCFSELQMEYSRAFFEAMSGVTTTGSTIITGLDTLPQGILIWRAMLLWLGGIGFLILGLAVLPLLQISGMQIYKSQSFGDIDKFLPSASQMAVYIWIIYGVLTLVCAVLLHVAGMTVFEAVCHAMATLATGGFSTSDQSIGYFNSLPIECVLIVFMLIGGMPFPLYLKMLRGDPRALLKDGQVRTFLRIVLALVVVMTAYLVMTGRFFTFDALTNAAFVVVSVITTTGYGNEDFMTWGPFVIGLVFMMTFMGSCSGSTAGGLKIFRLQILWAMLHQQLNKLMNPHGVFQVHYNGKIVEPSVQTAISGFFFVYMVSWVVFGVLLQLTGVGFTEAFLAAQASLTNVGLISGSFAHLPDSAIWVLSAAMLLGRLEFFTVLVLLTPRFWKQ